MSRRGLARPFLLVILALAAGAVVPGALRLELWETRIDVINYPGATGCPCRQLGRAWSLYLQPDPVPSARIFDAAGQRWSITEAPRRPLAGADLRGVMWTGASLRGVTFQNVNLEGAWLGDADLTGCRFLGCNLAKAHLVYAALQGALLEEVDLTGSDLCCADLTDARFVRVRLRDCKLAVARLAGADLSRCGKRAAGELEPICASYNRRTRWPPGFDPGVYLERPTR